MGLLYPTVWASLIHGLVYATLRFRYILQDFTSSPVLWALANSRWGSELWAPALDEILPWCCNGAMLGVQIICSGNLDARMQQVICGVLARRGPVSEGP